MPSPADANGAAPRKLGFDMVRRVAIDEDWTALRFRRKEFIRRDNDVMAAVVWCAIIANLGALDPHGWIWITERPVYGVIQRSLSFAWCVWLAGASLMLMANRRITRYRSVEALPAVE